MYAGAHPERPIEMARSAPGPMARSAARLCLDCDCIMWSPSVRWSVPGFRMMVGLVVRMRAGRLTVARSREVADQQHAEHGGRRTPGHDALVFHVIPLALTSARPGRSRS